MSDHITLVGNIAGELDERQTRGGDPIAAFRLAVNERRLDRERGEWVDGHTSFYNVSAFGDLGAHALASLRKGQRVILTGRLRVREWENETTRGVSADVVVDAIGHDLRWGTSQFTRTTRAKAAESTGPAEAPSALTDADGWTVPGASADTPVRAAAPPVLEGGESVSDAASPVEAQLVGAADEGRPF